MVKGQQPKSTVKGQQSKVRTSHYPPLTVLCLSRCSTRAPAVRLRAALVAYLSVPSSCRAPLRTRQLAHSSVRITCHLITGWQEGMVRQIAGDHRAQYICIRNHTCHLNTYTYGCIYHTDTHVHMHLYIYVYVYTYNHQVHRMCVFELPRGMT